MRSTEPQLSVVIPTRNERDNIPALLLTLAEALAGVATEVIFVDDSDDTTPQVIAAQAATYPGAFRVRLHHRASGPERAGGLATAVSAGMSIARAKYVAVLDADLQHPPERLRTLFDEAVRTDADVVLATRYLPGGGYEGLDGPSRKLISMGLKWVAKLVFPDQLLRVSDPLGGFFLVRRSIIEGVTLRPIGYKISLELLVRCTWVRLVEVPYHFQARATGQSKSDFKQGMMVLRHMGRLVREVPAGARFWKFALVGASGVVVNLALFALFQHLQARPWVAIAAATEVSILSNFALNVVWTWRDLPKRGRRDLLTRAALYHGAVAPVVAVYLGVSAFLAHYREPSVPTQVLSLIPALFLSYWLARRVVFAPRESWASLFHRPQRPLTVQEAFDDVLPGVEETAIPELPTGGQPQAGR
ncbi:MAG: glycosyltransferase [Ktedonobacterales bacterium]|nr:glycosyltransferase [Ktedonobacterales bacterium]